ncbi:MAG: transporter associated domain-containing protein, partial [Burkholderiaceae bacterium]
APGQFRVRALTPLEQFNEFFECQLDLEAADTIGGLVTDHLGRVPHRDELVKAFGFEFEVQRADARMAHVLLVRRLEVPESEPSHEPEGR